MIITDDSATAILTPIDGDGDGDGVGVGVDGRADEGEIGDLFRELRFQRKTVFRQELRASMGDEVPESDAWSWETLAEVARDYLIEHGKDLEPMAILVEAATRLDGIEGLDRAMNLLADLVAGFWDQGLYPAEDEDDGVEARFQPLSGLSGGSGEKDGTLIMPLRRLVLAGDPASGELRYIARVTADAKFASAQSGGDNRAELQQEAETALAEAEAIARALGARRLAQATTHLAAAEAGWRRAISFISERTKPRFPAASRLTDELRGMREWIEGLLRLVPAEATQEPGDFEAVEADAAVLAGGAAAGGGPMVFGRIATRADALRAVTAAADYFDRLEPLSPIGQTLREVDRRARLSFAELLEELIPDSDTRETYYWRSGIKPPAPPAEQEE